MLLEQKKQKQNHQLQSYQTRNFNASTTWGKKNISLSINTIMHTGHHCKLDDTSQYTIHVKTFKKIKQPVSAG